MKLKFNISFAMEITEWSELYYPHQCFANVLTESHFKSEILQKKKFETFIDNFQEVC